MSNLFMLDCGIQIDPMVPAFVRLLINAIKIIVSNNKFGLFEYVFIIPSIKLLNIFIKPHPQ